MSKQAWPAARGVFRPFIASILAGVLGSTLVIGLIFSMVLVRTPAHAASAAYVRVNQVGYINGETKRAILMASGSESGATFEVINTANGHSVYHAAIGASQGRWSNAYPNTYLLDFTAVTATGSYTVRVSGSIGADSPTFKIDSGAHLYGGLLPNALFFYQARRDGSAVNSSIMNRQPSHLTDQQASIYSTP
ncbi:MAG: hypothetical protein H0W02_20285, partial [Ktedonobacteraceae bacterium]|nr:hypothetical protein [Ktedonobacteraceae bacterium]